jgi:hypothetical protein
MIKTTSWADKIVKVLIFAATAPMWETERVKKKGKREKKAIKIQKQEQNEEKCSEENI